MRRFARRRSERGVTVIEAAIVLPFVLLLLLGIIEFGLAWRDVNTMERGLQTAARVGSGTGDGRFADYEALRSLSATVSGMAGAEIKRVIIYDVTAGNSNGQPPSGCLAVTPSPNAARGVSGVCNVYSREQAEAASPIGFPDNGSATACPGGSWDGNWCPLGRDDLPPVTGRYGMYVEVAYQPITNLLPGPTFNIDERAVFYIEPCVPGTGTPCD